MPFEAGNPYRWKAGQSGNPEGPKKRPSFEAIVAGVLDEAAPGTMGVSNREDIARRFVASVQAGEVPLTKELLARVWPATTKHQVESSGPIVFGWKTDKPEGDESPEDCADAGAEE